MGCPYLTEVKMTFCSAYPVKKLVPVDRVVTESACENEAHATCPAFREAVARHGGEAARSPSAAPEAAESKAKERAGCPTDASPQRVGRRAVDERGLAEGDRCRAPSKGGGS